MKLEDLILLQSSHSPLTIDTETLDLSITGEKYTVKEKIKCPKGIIPSGRPLHAKVGDGGWMGKLAPGLGRVGG
jgi:hypothetical protein